MKHYRLKKDLPTFKAGEDFVLWPSGLWRESNDIMAYSWKTLEKFPNILEEWFEEIEPTGPLFKDEKIRKAVRVWAEVNKTKYVWVSVTFDGISITQDERRPFPTEYKQSITFECEVEFKSGYYTIDELCGEEER